MVYDFVREKPYLLEDEEQSYKVSRNIYNTVDADNDKIVCAGYARLYEKIMNALGVKTNLVILHKNNGELVGHERVMIRIDDDYYDVHGLFSIDPTRDSRDKDDNTKWLYNYRGFMKNLMETKQWDDKNHYDNISVPFLTDHTIDDIDYIRESLKFDMPELMRQCMNSMTKFKKCSENTLKARKFVNYILSLYDLDLDDIEGNKALFNIFDENYDIIKEEFNAELSTSTFIQALMKVRHIESKLDPNKFTYDANELFRNIPRYNFKEKNEQHILNLSNPQQLFSNVLFGENKNVKPANEEEKKELLVEGYAYLCSKENSKIKAGEKAGLFKINKSINLYYNNKNINKK